MITYSKKIYNTWDEAFKALAPQVRQERVRGASYTQVLFNAVCNATFYENDEDEKLRMQGKNSDLAYKCALYHQLGKSLVPTIYQVWNKNFSEEEQALYRKYTSEGRILVSKLQERTMKRKVSSDFVEEPTENIAWLMLRETCEQHMERYDGTGYPEQRQGNEIRLIAQIVGLAKELDRLCSYTKSETPFEDAISTLVAEANRGFSEELIQILQSNRGKLKTVYRKYIQYTKAIPQTIPLVEKRKDRPMGLKYRPMIKGREGQVVAYEAVPWFKGNPNNGEDTETLQDLEGLFTRTKLLDDMTFYFLYEACDTVLRLQNCRLPIEGVIVPMLGGFYSDNSKLPRLLQLFEDQPIDKRLLKLTIPHSLLLDMDKAAAELVSQMVDEGIQFVVEGYKPEELSIEKLSELGIYNVRFNSNLYLNSEIANIMTVMKNLGFTIIGGSADSQDIMNWLDSCGASYMSGTLTGELVEEEILIKELLLKEQEND